MNEEYIYLEKLKERYKGHISFEKRESLLKKTDYIPEALKNLYEEVVSVNFPFGRIYSIDEAVMRSQGDMLKKKWLCFGENYDKSEKWLCLYTPDSYGRSFNICSTNVESLYALHKDFVEFLENIRMDFEDDPWNELLFDTNCII